jgi:endoglucanase
MKNALCLAVFAALFFLLCNSVSAIGNRDVDLQETEHVNIAPVSAPFSKGVNFGGWFEVADARRIQFNNYTEQDLMDVKNLGADVIRLPVWLYDMTDGPPDYTLDPLLLRLLDMAIGLAEKQQLYIIIANHSGGNNPDEKILVSVWEQIARRYKDRSDYIVYSILDEPHNISDRRWGEIQGRVIDAIRRNDQKHWIIVTGAEFGDIEKLYTLPEYRDSKLIYTFSFFSPMLFTHQGASWLPPLDQAVNIPFPPDANRMPPMPSGVRGTWVENAYREYSREASPENLSRLLDRAASFSMRRNAPVFCGGYGVLMSVSPPEDRIKWYELVTNAMDARNISRTIWGYFGGFGIFNFDGRGDFNSDLNTALVRALGFTPPRQIPQNNAPLASGFTIFDDYPGRNISAGSWRDDSVILNFYETNAADGEYAIGWENAPINNAFEFVLPRNGNFSALVSGGYFLEFKARTEMPVRFNVIFQNPESASSIPWQMRYTIDESVLPPDGRWHTIRIRLSDMQDSGAWSNLTQTWHNSQNAFKWENVDRLVFSTGMDLRGYSIFFDSIRITR